MDDKIFVEVITEELDYYKYIQKVQSPSCGGISSFIGQTRNTFNGKEVFHLEYEGYIPMAVAELKKICLRAIQEYGAEKVSIAHRLGRVNVGEASVIIAASAAHRSEAINAASWAINELKSTVPIWKKEFFTDGSVWKENAESRRL